MQITIRGAQLNAQEIQIGDIITLQEIRVNGTGITLGSPGGAVQVAEAGVTFIVTEAALNRFLAGRAEGRLRDMEVAMLNGRVRLTGRFQVAGPLWIPFSAAGAPEIEGGARLRVNWQQINPVGVPVPHAAVQVIGEIINNRLAAAFDVTKLPLDVRLASLTVETGRLLLTAAAAIEFRPAETAIEKTGSRE
jgi:hypothetical protein